MTVFEQSPFPVRLRIAAASAGKLWLFCLLPVIASAWMLEKTIAKPDRMVDFHYGFLGAADAVSRGGSPYPAPSVALVKTGEAFVYPPPLAWALVPFTWLPSVVSSVLFTILILAALALALWLFDVRDVRCYGIVALWQSTMATETTGALSAFLVLFVAVAWHYRDDSTRTGLAVAAAVTLKLFLWPLGLWLLVTHRLRALIFAVAVSLAAIAAAWAAIGFAGVREYPHLLSLLSRLEAPQSFTVPALVTMLGGTILIGRVVSVILLAPLFAWAYRQRGAPNGDRIAFKVAIVASLTLTPIAWSHYFVLLIALCALTTTEVSLIWFIPFLVWIAAPHERNDGSMLGLVGYLVAFLLVVLLSVRSEFLGGATEGQEATALGEWRDIDASETSDPDRLRSRELLADL